MPLRLRGQRRGVSARLWGSETSVHSHTQQSPCGRTLRVTPWAGCLVLLALVAGCPQARHAEEPVSATTAPTESGEHTSGPWTYVYSVSNPGTRSEGYHGVLSYEQIEVPTPMHISQFYETPWGRLYWIGMPAVPFGDHGWMSKPLAREPVGQALIDPGIVHSGRFLVHVKMVAPEELATPDRLEKDPKVLEALQPFGLTTVHVQSDWFPLGPDPVTLHDTKRWGTLKVCRADTNQIHAPALEFECTNELGVSTSPKPVSLGELMVPPAFPLKATRISLCPAVNTLQPIQCTLSPIIGDPLVLYLVCRIEDQGPKPPWKSPGIRYFETDPSIRAATTDVD